MQKNIKTSSVEKNFYELSSGMRKFDKKKHTTEHVSGMFYKATVEREQNVSA